MHDWKFQFWWLQVQHAVRKAKGFGRFRALTLPARPTQVPDGCLMAQAHPVCLPACRSCKYGQGSGPGHNFEVHQQDRSSGGVDGLP